MNSYGPLAAVYDALTRDVDYGAWARYLRRHFARTGGGVRRVVDLACGTGSLTVRLARLGYQVTGVDLSPQMLARAKNKSAHLTPPPLLLRQDMSRLRLSAPADAVVCCLDSLNYVTHPQAVRRTFRRVWACLRPGGLFLFDIRTPAMLRAMDGKVCGDEAQGVLCRWRGSFSPRRRLLTYRMALLFPDAGGHPARAREVHTQYAYDPDLLERWLGWAGFSRVRRYGELTMAPPGPDAARIFIAARKDVN